MCRNVGCNESFKWRMQLSRHVLKCSKPVLTKTDAIVETQEGYQCSCCGRNYKFKENVYRHFKICKLRDCKKNLSPSIDEYFCRKCHREFSSKHDLTAHEKLCKQNKKQDGVYVDTSNEENVVLVIPLDDNLVPLDGSTQFPSDEGHAIKSEFSTISSDSTQTNPSLRFSDGLASKSDPIKVPTVQQQHSMHVATLMSHPYDYIPKSSHHLEVIPTSHHHVEHLSFAVDVKTVHRSTCPTCGRDFVRRDHFQRHVNKCAKNQSLSAAPEVQSFTCPNCDRKYQRRDHFERHVQKCKQIRSVKRFEKEISAPSNDDVNSLNKEKKHLKLSDKHLEEQPAESNIIDLTENPRKVANVPMEICNVANSSFNQSKSSCSPPFYSINRETCHNYLWKKSLNGSANKVTIINNVKQRFNADRSQTLQNVTDKIVNNLTNERRRNLENMALQSIFEESSSSRDNNIVMHNVDTGNDHTIDRSLSLQTMTERLIENYSDELSNMDCHELMSNGKKKYMPKDNKEQHHNVNGKDAFLHQDHLVDKNNNEKDINEIVLNHIKPNEIKEENKANVDSIESSDVKIKSEDEKMEEDATPTFQSPLNSPSAEKVLEFENNVCYSLIGYLKSLKRKTDTQQFEETMKEIFQKKLDDKEFLDWLHVNLQL